MVLPFNSTSYLAPNIWHKRGSTASLSIRLHLLHPTSDKNEVVRQRVYLEMFPESGVGPKGISNCFPHSTQQKCYDELLRNMKNLDGTYGDTYLFLKAVKKHSITWYVRNYCQIWIVHFAEKTNMKIANNGEIRRITVKNSRWKSALQGRNHINKHGDFVNIYRRNFSIVRMVTSNMKMTNMSADYYQL